MLHSDVNMDHLVRVVSGFSTVRRLWDYINILCFIMVDSLKTAIINSFYTTCAYCSSHQKEESNFPPLNLSWPQWTACLVEWSEKEVLELLRLNYKQLCSLHMNLLKDLLFGHSLLEFSNHAVRVPSSLGASHSGALWSFIYLRASFPSLWNPHATWAWCTGSESGHLDLVLDSTTCKYILDCYLTIMCLSSLIYKV